MRLVVVSLVASGTLIGLSRPAGAVPIPWKNCGTAGDPISVVKFDASVWPPQRGHPITLSYQWVASRAIDPSAYEVVTLSSPSGPQFPLWLPVVPLPAGPYSGSTTFTVPRWLPSGTVLVVHRVWFDGDGTRLACMDVTIPVK